MRIAGSVIGRCAACGTNEGVCKVNMKSDRHPRPVFQQRAETVVEVLVTGRRLKTLQLTKPPFCQRETRAFRLSIRFSLGPTDNSACSGYGERRAAYDLRQSDGRSSEQSHRSANHYDLRSGSGRKTPPDVARGRVTKKKHPRHARVEQLLMLLHFTAHFAPA
jgi:hypothetical protein